MSDQPLDPVRELLEEYALGLLNAGERVAVEARLAASPGLRQELAAINETLALLALSTPVMPDASLKDRVLARIAETPDSSDRSILALPVPRRRPPTSFWLGAALAASLALAMKLDIDLRSARSDAAAARIATATARRSVTQRDSLIAQLVDPSVELITLAATGAAKPAIKAYLNRSRRVLLLSVAVLETPPAGQTYQLWFIVGGKPIPSVTFKPDSSGRAIVRDVPMPAGVIGATAITREPDGGSATPTLPILFAGKLATE